MDQIRTVLAVTCFSEVTVEAQEAILSQTQSHFSSGFSFPEFETQFEKY